MKGTKWLTTLGPGAAFSHAQIHDTAYGITQDPFKATYIKKSKEDYKREYVDALARALARGSGNVLGHDTHPPVLITTPPDNRLHACNYCNTTARGESLCPNCGAPR